MTKTTDGDGGGIIAFDAPWDFSAPVLDLTSHDIVKTETTKDWGRDETPTKEEGTMTTEQPYQKFLREHAETQTTAADMSDDALYEQFAEQSGMNDMLGRTPQAGTADLSARVEEKAGASDDAMYQAFIEQSGMSWMLGDAGRADLTEEGKHEPRNEADELNDALRRQNGLDTYGEDSDLSAEVLWERYRDATGQGS